MDGFIGLHLMVTSVFCIRIISSLCSQHVMNTVIGDIELLGNYMEDAPMQYVVI